MKNSLFLLAVLLLASCTESFYIGKINGKDRKGQKHGLWVNYWDDEKTIPMTKYIYRHGEESLWNKVYHYNGKLAIKFKPRGDRLRVKYFDEYRQLSHKGWANFDITEEEIHYYWQGEWKYYNTYRKPVKSMFFKEGTPHLVVYHLNGNNN